MITPDPSMPDPSNAPVEPIENHLDRIEAAANVLFDDEPVICSAGCQMQPDELLPAGSALPRVIGYRHQKHCRLYGTDEA